MSMDAKNEWVKFDEILDIHKFKVSPFTMGKNIAMKKPGKQNLYQATKVNITSNET